MTGSRKIDIYPHNVEKHLQFSRDNLTTFVNSMIEKYFEGRLIEVGEETKSKIKRLTEPDQLNRSAGEVIDYIFATYNFEVEKTEKPTLKLPAEKKLRTRRGGINPITNY